MKRYKYNMHHQWLTAPRIGELHPVFIQEVTPGDTWSGKSTGVFRLAPLDVPSYMSLNVFVNFFFVPHRIVWDEFEDVITGADTTTSWPTITWGAAQIEHWYRFGATGGTTTSPSEMNALPVRAFNKVFNEHFRNHLIETERSLDSTAIARVRFPTSDYYGGITDEIQQGSEETIDTSNPTLGITNVTDAIRRQRIKEKRSQYGERYTDLLASYGINAPDSRLDRPEHVARGKTTIGISEVVATATSTSENTGEYRGHGIAGMNIRFPKRRFNEHGTLIGVMYARPRLQLFEKFDKHWYIQDKEDLYHPELSGDTQVVVKNREVYSTASAADGNFGYQARDEWLRSPRDIIAGNMAVTAQKPWTAHVDLSAVPTQSYLQQVQDYDHLFQDQTSDRVDLHSFFDHKIAKLSIVRPRKK
jgi:hypothetical protein